MEQIQIPFGMRDLILDECIKKRSLQHKIEHIFESYGYDEVMTPSVEFYSTYLNAFDDVQEEDMFKLFDQNGKIIALHTDMTVPIARVCATKFKDIQPPYRCRYTSNVYKVRKTFAGKRSEVTDCGIECIGMEKSNLEVLLCAIDVMESLNMEYTLEIGNVNVFKYACSNLNIPTDLLQSLIDRKSMVELKAYLKELNLDKAAFDFFMELPFLSGNADILDSALKGWFNKECKETIETLKELVNTIKRIKPSAKLTFDLGKVPHFEYYTGIIFEGFVENVGTSVLSGGRYDQLLKKFGQDLPACGFSVKLDYLLDGMDVEKEEKLIVAYPLSKQEEAYKLADALRKDKKVICMIQDIEDIQIQEVA